jgi:hypothetical protein
MPRHFEINQVMRRIGWATEYRIGAYDGPAAAYREGVDAQGALYALFRPEWEVADPGKEQVGGAHHWYYAVRPKPDGVSINYIVQTSDATVPDDFQLVGTRDGLSVYVRHRDTWEADRFRDQETDYRNALYEIPRDVRFAFLGVPAGRYFVNLAEWPGLWRLF